MELVNTSEGLDAYSPKSVTRNRTILIVFFFDKKFIILSLFFSFAIVMYRILVIPSQDLWIHIEFTRLQRQLLKIVVTNRFRV